MLFDLSLLLPGTAMLRHPACLFAVLAVFAAPALRAQVPAALADAVRAQGAPDAAGLAGAAAAALGGETRLVAADGVAQDRFGFSVAVSGTHALVGAYGRESGRGAAYAFEFENGAWVPKNTLRASDGAANHQFGWAVAISGDRAFVTAPGIAAAYAFVWTGAAWAQRARLVPPATLVADYGFSVAMSGDRAIVGASYSSTTPGTATGAAFVYAASGSSWVLQQQLGAGQAAPGDNYGYAVAISGDRVLVGAYRDNFERGSVVPYIFNGTSWTAQARFRGTEITPGDRFGIAVALNGDRALVGADESGAGGNAGGAAFVYEWNGSAWVQRQRLVASDRPPTFPDRWDERFGGSVALSGDHAVVGAQYARVDPTDTSGPVERGAAYLFAYDGTWRETAKLTASDWTPNDRFGSAVAIGGEAALVGAWAKNSARGAAYIYGIAVEEDIVVNDTDDDPDPDPADGRCDTEAGTPGEQCTLRGAIQTANAVTGDDRVVFDFAAAQRRGGVSTITLTEPLPTVTEPVTVDASAAGAARGGAAPLVVVAGAGTVETGLVLAAGESTVRGFAFVGFTRAAIRIEGPGGNTVEGNYIGVDPDGTTLRGNQVGVLIVGSRENVIGGATAAQRNVIGVPPTPAGTVAGETAAGITISGDGADATVVAGNYIGVTASGTAMLATASDPRSSFGIFILSADSTVIGGAPSAPGAAPGNVISGLLYGVIIGTEAGPAATAATFDTDIRGNLIGTNAAGTDSLSNNVGVFLRGGVLFTEIGGASSAEGNVISGNQAIGIVLNDSEDLGAAPLGTRIVGNTIGLTANGLTPLGNDFGVVATGNRVNGVLSPGVRGVVIGDPGFPRNLIAGNRVAQIVVFGAGFFDYAGPDATPEQIASTYVFVRNNYLGLRADGQVALTGDARTPFGIIVAGGSRTYIGAEGGRNVISGHSIGLLLDSEKNVAFSNYIGTDPSGVEARPNIVGILVAGAPNLVGPSLAQATQLPTNGALLALGNVISGNEYAGVYLAPGIASAADTTTARPGRLDTRRPGDDLSGVLAEALASTRGGWQATLARARRGAAPAARGGTRFDDAAFVIGNRIGVSATGAPLSNGAGWVSDPEFPEAEVGGGVLAFYGQSVLLLNVVAGNVGDGVAAYQTRDARTEVTLVGNLVGLSGLAAPGQQRVPNTRDGLFVLGADARVGETPGDDGFPPFNAATRNVFWDNGRNGISTTAFGRLYVTNGSFLGNGALGLDAGIAAPDGPGVPAGFLLTPRLFNPTLRVDNVTGDSTLLIPVATPPATEGGGTLQHRVEVYLSGVCDGSGYGEGATSSFGLTTTADTRTAIEIDLADAGPDLRRIADAGVTLTATVTQVLSPSGGLPPLYRTSEFSECTRLALPDDVDEAAILPGETGPVLDGPGVDVVVETNPAVTGTPARAGASGGTLYAARFAQAPQRGAFQGSATAPDGSTVTPNAVSPNRSWALTADGLAGITYEACLDIDGLYGVRNAGQLLVATRARPGLAWTPRASTLTAGRLCAAGLTTFGEFAIAADSLVNPVAIESGPGDVPGTAAPSALAVAAWPNPAAGRVSLSVAVPAGGDVRVDVFDALGRRVARVHDGPLAAGTHPFALDASALPAGVYVVRLLAGSEARSQRLVVVR